ncbi:hypothetical protein TCAL_16159 [Tigriopus californicus]|uniref:Uncharacterized protein n=2 Tax=Tigriopus californicus TaxID=6832 RepID=A0A553P3T5_TIGCA|nr:hypothetical protein TCAL_16159 [Tigriopus californicus]
MGAEQEQGPVEGDTDKDKDQIRCNYGIVIQSDITNESRRKEMMEICQIACEKFAPAEKSPLERDNQAAAEMIKATLDQKMSGPFNVIVGESFSSEMDFVQNSLLYMFFGGYLAILVWKCV